MFKILSYLMLIMSTVVFADTDPTKPFSFSGAVGNTGTIKKEALVLKSIIHGSGIHTVIINEQLLKVGDYIGEFKLIAVNDQSVLLRSATESKKLYIFSQAIVK